MLRSFSFLQNKQILVRVLLVRTGPAVILRTKLISIASVQMVLWEIPAMSKATKLFLSFFPLSHTDKMFIFNFKIIIIVVLFIGDHGNMGVIG